MLIVGKYGAIEKFKREIKKRFEAKDLGEATHMLSMKISRESNGSITLDQAQYIEEILEAFNMNYCKGASTPLDPNIKYRKVNDEEWNKIKDESSKIPYRQAIGSLIYLTCGTRSDIAIPSTYMSQFNERPTDEHWRGYTAISERD